MYFREYLDVLGAPIKEIPCIKGSGAPTENTVGAVGCFYMDTDNGDLYKCTAVSDGSHTWVAIISQDGDVVKTVNGVAPDENGNVEVEIPEVSVIELDTTLSESGKAADAKVVGDAIADVNERDRGLSAYEVAVNNGFEGSETEWLSSLTVDSKALKAVDEYKVEIKEVLNYAESRNLFDCHYSETENVDGLTITYTNGYASNYAISSTGIISESESGQISYMIPVKGGVEIYFHNKLTQVLCNVGWIYYYDATGSFISREASGTDGMGTSPINAAYIRLVAAALTGAYFMVNYDGIVGAPWEPYKAEYHVTDNEARGTLQSFDLVEKVDPYKNDKIYNESVVESLRSDLEQLRGYISSIHEPTILDSGACGENLTWTLYSDGLLKISGTGRSYDFIKGILIGKTEEEVNTYAETTEHSAYAFVEGKTYVQSTSTVVVDGVEKSIGYVSPWYRYRKEVFPDGVTDNGYCTKEDYEKWNPNGWTYNRIEVDRGVTYIGDWMFYRICNVSDLVIPDTVTEIGNWSIRFSPSLNSIYLPDSVTTIGLRGCSRNEVAKAIRLGSSLVNVGDYALAQNHKVKYLNVSGDIENMGVQLFQGDVELTHVSFDGVKTLNASTCTGCVKLEKVDLPETLISIGYGVFMNTGLKSVRIPESVASIDTNAFYGCDSLFDVYIDSPTIASSLNDPNGYDFGHLCRTAKRIYVRNDIINVGSLLLNNYVKCAEIGGYTLYARK